jgi:hypothetical protein
MPDDNPQGGEQEAIQKLLDKHKGDAMALALQLFSENFQLREKNRDLKKQIPAEGSVTVSKADHDKLEAYKTLGKPDELKTRLDGHATLETENAELKRDGVLRDIAGELGWKVSVLKDRDKASGGSLEYLFREEGEGDKKKRVPYVKTEQGEVSLEKYASDSWGDYLTALKAEGSSAEPKRGLERSPRPAGGDNIFEATRKGELARQEAAAKPQTLRERFRGATART